MKIALVTYNTQGKYNPDTDEDLELKHFLIQKGLDIEIVIWDDPLISWANYDLAILKSPWDYHEKFQQFTDWLDHLETSDVKLLNPVKTVRWNLDKHYLNDISKAGLPVIPTEFLEPNNPIDLDQYFGRFNSATLIVKPAVSGGSKNTFMFDRQEAAEITRKLIPLLKKQAFMVQPFVEEIRSEGEWSFLFFNQAFSHSILKKTKPGDFRVQGQFGGTVHSQPPPADVLAQTEKYVKQFAAECLYCRVDGVRINGVFHLMELELIEPSLFLDADKNSFEKYHAALKVMLAGR